MISLSLKIPYCGVASFPLVMRWGDKMPTWWHEVGWMAEAPWWVLSYDWPSDHVSEDDHLFPPPAYWLRVTKTTESKTAGPTALLCNTLCVGWWPTHPQVQLSNRIRKGQVHVSLMMAMRLYRGTDHGECGWRKGPCILHGLSWGLVAGEELEVRNHAFSQELRKKFLEPCGSEQTELRSKLPGLNLASHPPSWILDGLTSWHLCSHE